MLLKSTMSFTEILTNATQFAYYLTGLCSSFFSRYYSFGLRWFIIFFCCHCCCCRCCCCLVIWFMLLSDSDDTHRKYSRNAVKLFVQLSKWFIDKACSTALAMFSQFYHIFYRVAVHFTALPLKRREREKFKT